MSRFSNVVNHDSPDGLPSNPHPKKAIKTICCECQEEIETEVCPECGAENEIEYEPDFDAGEKEYEKD